jgi:hypothetical protein
LKALNKSVTVETSEPVSLSIPPEKLAVGAVPETTKGKISNTLLRSAVKSKLSPSAPCAKP